MCENMRALLENITPYVKSSRVFDIVQTKFGLVSLVSGGHGRMLVDCEVLPDFNSLMRVFLRELDCDVADEHEFREMTAEDATELRRRAEPYIAGLPNETHARELLDEYIAEQLS